MKRIESIGVSCAIVGSFLVALNIRFIGYCFFLLSSALLTYTAWKQGNKNLVILQGFFLSANLIGILNS